MRGPMVCGGNPNFERDATWRAGSEAVGYPVSNLADDRLSLTWRSTGLARSLTWLEMETDVAELNTTIDAIGLIGYNKQDSGNANAGVLKFWQVRIDEFPIWNRIRPNPNALYNVTNYTGTTSSTSGVDIDDSPDDPDGRVLEPTVDTNPTSVDMDFNLFTASERPLKVGADLQTFRLLLRHSTGGGTAASVTLKLLNASGSTVLATIGTETVNVSNDTLVSRSWNAALLSSPSAGFRLRVEGTPGTTGGVVIEAVEFLARLDGHLYDSGDLAGASVFGLSAVPAYRYMERKRLDAFHVLPAADSDLCTVDGICPVSIALGNIAYVHYELVCSPPADFLEVSLGIARHGIVPSMGVAAQGGIAIKWIDNTSRLLSTNLTPWYNVKGNLFKQVTVNYQAVTRDELVELFDDAEGGAGLSGRVALIPFPDEEDTFATFNAFGSFMELSESPSFTNAPPTPGLLWTKPVQVTETG